MEHLYKLFKESTGVCTDTRKIKEGCLFISLKGANFNGNTFAQEALKQGARYAIVDEEAFEGPDCYLVSDCLKFLQDLAHHHRMQFDIPVIGITGSNGKTSTKELINAVLSTKYHVLATKGNLNNHIGVPLTLLEMDATHEIAIIEMGANRFKDIEELCAIARPTYGIITNIGKAHLEGFGGFEGVLKTKRELYESVEQAKGTIVYNFDDQVLTNALPSGVTTFTYGQSEGADVTGEIVKLTPFVHLKWQTKDYTSDELTTQLIGKYNFYNFLAAITFGRVFGLTPDEINAGVQNYAPTNNRSQVKQTGNNTLIMDCYNANPTSMRSALESFALIEHPHKLFIIGDMLELGTESEKEHLEIARLAESMGLNGWTVGPIFKQVSSPAFTQQFDKATAVTAYLNDHPESGQLILLKGSRGIGLEVLENNL